MCFFKKTLAVLISVFMVCINVNMSVMANDDITIETSENTAKYQTGGATIYASGKAGINATNWLEFKPTIANGGQYEVWINGAAVSNSVAALYINASPTDGQPLSSGAAPQSTVTVNTGDWSTFSDYLLGTVSLSAGTPSLCFGCKSGGFTLWHIKLKPIIPEFKITKIMANGTEFSGGDTIPRGTDMFTVEFSTAIDEDSIDDAEISIDMDGTEVKTDIEVSEKKLNIYLKESFDYEKDCELTIKNINGKIAQWDESEKKVSFKTSAKTSDTGKGSLKNITHQLKFGKATITGELFAQKSIKGRKVGVKVILPSGGNISLNDVVSGDNGEIKIEYSFTDESEDGTYKFYLTPEYAASAEMIEIEYNPYENNKILIDGKKDNFSAFYPDNMTFWSSGVVSVNATNWLEFDIDVENEGEYTVKLDASSVSNSMTSFSVDDTEVLNSMFINTESYQTYLNLELGKITLTEGTHKIKFSVKSGAISLRAIQFMCITEKQVKMLLSTLEATKTVGETQAWLEKNGNIIGLDLTADLYQLNNKEKFYRHFVGLRVDSLEEIKDAYYKNIVLERFNQGDGKNKQSILETEADCEKLGFDNKILGYFPNHYREFLDEITVADDYENVDKLLSKINGLCEKYIKEEYNKDIVLKTSNVSSFIGKDTAIPLSTDFALKGVTKINLVVDAPESLLKNAYFTSGNGYEVKTVYPEANKPNVFKLEFDKCHDLGDLLGTLSVASMYELNNKITLSGTVTINVVCGNKNIEISNNIMPCDLTVSINKNTSNPTYSGGGGGGGGGSAAPSPVKPPTDKESETTQPPVDNYIFTDLDTVDWAKESIRQLYEKNIISLNEEKLYYPNKNITREEFVKMVVMSVGAMDDSAQVDFNDIKSTDWAYPYIASAVKYGIVDGKTNGSFGIGEEITRQDMATILARVLLKIGFTFDEIENKFSDDDIIADYAKDGVYLMKTYGIINGMGDNLFEPKLSSTRAMAAKVIYEMLKVVE